MEQAGPSAARRLFDLPVSCLQHIVSFMDWCTKRQFFRTSKGSQDEPGCAVLVLRAPKLECTYNVQPQNICPRPALSSLLHWASQISTDMELVLFVGGLGGDNSQLLDALHNLLLYPDASATPTGRVLGRPTTYPGITSLKLHEYTCSSFIPGLVADAFPNLKSFTATWRPDTSQPLGPVLQGRLTSLQHMSASLSIYTAVELTPATRQHVAQQLSHMPSLTYIGVDDHVFQAVPAAVLAKLTRLKLNADNAPTAKDKAALKACAQLESLELLGTRAGDWVQALPLCAPSIRTLDAAIDLIDNHMAPLLALPQLTNLTMNGLSRLSDDYSSAPDCRLKHIQCHLDCSTNITKLPLHTLDSPVKCSWFSLALSDHAADLAAIRAAKPHLLRCGGIKMNDGTLMIVIPRESPITKEQAAEVLQEWAPCLPGAQNITAGVKPVVKGALAELWPGATLLFY